MEKLKLNNYLCVIKVMCLMNTMYPITKKLANFSGAKHRITALKNETR